MGACPERIISFKNYSVQIIGSMLKAIHVPEEDEEKPRILVLACENDAYPALDMVGINPKPDILSPASSHCRMIARSLFLILNRLGGKIIHKIWKKQF